MGTILEKTQEKVGKFHFDEFEVHAEVTTHGTIAVFETGLHAGATGGRIVNRESLIAILTFAVPLTSGALLTIFGLYRKYPTEMKYIYRLWPTWIYISLSAAGSLVFTLYVGSKGTQIVGDPVLNTIIFGMVSPAVFLGVASRFSVSSPSTTGTGKQLKTLQEYVYTTLEDAISRKKMQNMIKVAMDTHKSNGATPAAFIIAKVQALQKDPDGSLYHLNQALQVMPSLKSDILANEVDWWILAGMTHGERQ